METKLVQSSKAFQSILRMSLGIVVLAQPKTSVSVDVLIIALQLFLLSYILFSLATTMPVVLEHPAKAFVPMYVTLSGMYIFDRILQPRKAELPIVSTLRGILIDDIWIGAANVHSGISESKFTL